MIPPISEKNMKSLLKTRNCASELDMWYHAQPLDDPMARRIDAIADETEGIPRLREVDGYLLLDAGDDEHIHVFLDDRRTRRELLGQILKSMPKAAEDGAEDVEDYPERADGDHVVEDEDFPPDEEPDYEVHEKLGKPRPGKGR